MRAPQVQVVGPICMALVALLSCTSTVDEQTAQQESAIVLDVDAGFRENADGGFRQTHRLRPVLNCVAPDSSSHLVAHFGYRNPFTATLNIPVGPFNAFLPPPFDRGQPGSFGPGDGDNVVAVPLGPHGWGVEWELGLERALAWRDSPPCVPTFAGATSAAAISADSISVTWSAATDFSTASSNIVYDICMSTASGNCASNFVVAATTSPGVTSWDMTGLAPSTTYYMVVRARNPAGEEDSNTVEVSAETCPSGQMACSGVCVSTSSDPANCGACGNACASGLCANSQCCSPDQTLCNGACTTTSTDPANCGACGSNCSAPSVCLGGNCCGSGSTPCNGKCTSTVVDPQNCGACGNVCSSQCVNGVCVPPCPAFQLWCNGTCVPLGTASNCVTCGPCSSGNGCTWVGTLQSGPPRYPACVACSSSGVSPALTMCDGLCISTDADGSNCGACGNVCASGLGCLRGQCVACAAFGRNQCNGACVSSDDNLNCGACGNVCNLSAGVHCVNGRCTSSCTCP